MQLDRAKRATLLALLLMVGAFSEKAGAAEFQQSHWPRGYYDIFAGFVPDPGVYVRNDLIMYSGRAEPTALAGATDLEYSVNLMRVTAFTPMKVLGANLGASLVGTVVSADVEVDIGPFTLSDNETGIGDSGLSPALLAWKWGNFNTTLVLTFIAPTGKFDREEVVNLGRNHWTFAPQLTFTYYDAQKGLDVSAAFIYTTSWENRATRYRTGDIFHIDAAVTKTFGFWRFGAVGFLQNQVTDDSGAGATLGSFHSDVYGLGGLVGFTLTGGEDAPAFIHAKWFREFGAKNAFEGDLFTVMALFKF